jgi:hypothetical protein
MKNLREIDIEIWDKVKYKDMNGLLSFIDSDEDKYRSYSSLYHYLEMPLKEKVGIFKSIYNKFDIDFKSKSVLDIGPGSGESLLEAKDRGATSLAFIDRDAIITRYCELLGFKAIFIDYLYELTHNTAVETTGKHDIVISKGAFNADSINNRPEWSKPAADWLNEITNEVCVFIPTWERGIEVDGNFHTCVGDRYKAHLNSQFHNDLIGVGFKLVENDESIDNVMRFPISYVLKK